MFKVITIEDTILIPPRLFSYPRLAALEHMINARFSDRIIPHIGLCIALWDWLRVGDDHLVMHTGESSTLCIFRMVVFAPFVGEVLFGRINASHETGLFVEMGFFDGILIERTRLPRPSEWDEKEKVWIWKPEVGEEAGAEDEAPTEEGGAAQALYMDVSNECVFRVIDCVYEDYMRVKPTEREGGEGRKNVMSIRGSLYDDVLENNQGLGDPLWWFEGEEGEEEVGEEAEEGEEGEEEVGEEAEEGEEGEHVHEEGEHGHEEGEHGHEEGGVEAHDEEAEYNKKGANEHGEQMDEEHQQQERAGEAEGDVDPGVEQNASLHGAQEGETVQTDQIHVKEESH